MGCTVSSEQAHNLRFAQKNQSLVRAHRLRTAELHSRLGVQAAVQTSHAQTVFTPFTAALLNLWHDVLWKLLIVPDFVVGYLWFTSVYHCSTFCFVVVVWQLLQAQREFPKRRTINQQCCVWRIFYCIKSQCKFMLCYVPFSPQRGKLFLHRCTESDLNFHSKPQIIGFMIY